MSCLTWHFRRSSVWCHILIWIKVKREIWLEYKIPEKTQSLKSPSPCPCVFQERLPRGGHRPELPRPRGRPHPYPRWRGRPTDDQGKQRTGGQGQETCQSVPVGNSRNLHLWPFCLQHWGLREEKIFIILLSEQWPSDNVTDSDAGCFFLFHSFTALFLLICSLLFQLMANTFHLLIN